MPPRRPARNRKNRSQIVRRIPQPKPAVAKEQSEIQQGRNPALDSVRGLAIVLMVIDHIAGILANVPILPDTIRFGTRLSLPLFAVLIGYFMAKDTDGKTVVTVDDKPQSVQTRHRLLRWGQILLAAAITNALTFQVLHKLEILASFAVVYGFYFILGRQIQWLLIALPLYAYDPSIDYFDYPVLLVASLVAVGAFVATRPLPIALLLSAAMIVVGTPLIPPPSIYVVWFLPLAMAIVATASRWPDLQQVWLTKLGRIPLTAYVIQYVVIMLVYLVWK